MAILDQYGRPVNVGSLTKPQAEPGLTGIRQIWAGSIASGLTPKRLARILAECDQGNLDAFLTLAEEMEERDPHYQSVLGIRKRVISGIAPTITPASDSAKDKEIAEQVRIRIAEHDGFGDMVEDLLDALGKGFAVVEVDWARSAKEWWPTAFEYRDPRWFVFEREKGVELRLKDDADPVNGVPLTPFKFIQHRAKLKSGLVYRGGLARLVAFSWMCKAYTLKDWMAFIETYGLPLRLGRYGPDATPTDVQTLFRAVANIGTDAAAVLPQNMSIDFENGPAANSDKIFENLARYIDEQVSKAVLGQTMTSDNGSSMAQANVHNEVRHDIAASDARAVTASINRDLVRMFVDLNFEGQKSYPRLVIKVDEPEDTNAKITNAVKPMRSGVTLKASELRATAGFSDPEPGDEIVCGKVMGGNPEAANRSGAGLALNRTDSMLEEDPDDWQEVADGILDAVAPLIEGAASYEEILAKLPETINRMPTALVVDTLVKSMFKARSIGDAQDG